MLSLDLLKEKLSIAAKTANEQKEAFFVLANQQFKNFEIVQNFVNKFCPFSFAPFHNLN
jgi:hypothetical protein